MHLYQPDDCVPATRMLFDTEKLSGCVKAWLPDAGKLSLDSIRYKPRTSCLVSYRYDTPDQEPAFVHIKAFSAEDWQTRKQKLVSKHPGVLVNDELAFALFKYPFDTEIPALQQFDAAPTEFVSRVLFESFQGEVVSSVRTLAYKPNRRYTAKVDFESGRRAVVKLHDQSTFERVMQSATLLKKPSMIQTPDRIGRSNRYQTLAYEWVVGDPVDFAIESAEGCLGLLKEIFDYLDRLHGASEKPGTANVELLKSLNAMGQYIGEIYPPLIADSSRIAKRIARCKPRLDNSTIIHGDFHERQLLKTDSSVTACDLDDCSIGDATTDLASFVGHLQYRACIGEVSHDLVNSIDELSLGHLRSRDAAERYQWHRTSALFRLASHPFRSGASNWVQQTEKVLGLVEQQIESQRKASVCLLDSETQQVSVADNPKLSSNIKADEKLAFLCEAFDLSSAQKQLQHSVPEFESTLGKFELVDVSGWRHKAGRRCMVKFELQTERGPKFVLGKASAKRLDKKTRNAQSALHDSHGFGRDSKDGISVPKPMGSLAVWKMWFQEKVPGCSCGELLERGQIDSVTDRIADAIAKLHKCDLLVERHHTMEKELTILSKRLQVAGEVVPLLAERIEGIWENCDRLGQAIEVQATAPIHRDFYQDQILFSENRTTLVDLDLVAMGHPALDVGNFLAHLTEHSIRNFGHPDQWSEEEHQIQSRYLRLNSDVLSEDILAFKILSLARHIAISASRKNRIHSTPLIIDEVEAMFEKHFQNQLATR